ncbi:hypothetical protein [Novosphingobium terrae]|uniref:hypothetical protein n=1 Tax=Novosphingobium terrae TaxID=2726189 RepID=UPI00197EC5BE|nr:hypothetical protein [Novosphingobium terrae]
MLALASAGLLALGGGVGAAIMAHSRPAVTMAPATPVAISSLANGVSDGIVTIRGKIAEVYGDKFIVADASGHTLVDVGRKGAASRLVALGQPITVQGRFSHGFLQAAFLVGADNKVEAVEPWHGHGRGHHHGRYEDDGPNDHEDKGLERGDNGVGDGSPKIGASDVPVSKAQTDK